ncbi:MAG TPA: FkbM family methyltransferase [Candidatus Nitrosocosmicus sp.]|jgi:FkbM family methyltransferase
MKIKKFIFKRLFSFFLSEKNYHTVKGLKIILDIVTKKDYNGIFGLFSKILPANATIIDIGANMGQCTGRFSRALPCSEIYSIEPIKDNYKAINKMVKFLQLKNVKVFQIGISEKEGEASIMIPVLKGVTIGTRASLDNRKAFKNKDVKLKAEKIWTERLGSFILANRIKHIDLIKIDTEGFDYKVLNSAKEEIIGNKPIIMIEKTWDNPEISWLYEIGYEPFKIYSNRLYYARENENLPGDSVLIQKDFISNIEGFIGRTGK